jgi:HAE1 family hydrophobic/amphiphilic exporter-1
MVSPIGKTVLGGLSFGTLMTLFLMPTVYYIVNKSSDRRHEKAEARRERIAAGLSRKQAREQSANVIAREGSPAVFAEFENGEARL